MAFNGYLKQSATPTIVLGPFLDSTDGVTAKTAASPVPKLSKNGAAFAARSDATAIAHMENGYYSCVFNATDTGTLGILAIGATGTASIPIRQDYLVVTADEWDRLHDTVGAVPAIGIIDRGTAQSATSTTLVLRAAATFADDTIIGATLMAFGSTQGYWQSRSVTDYVLSTDTATVDAWTVTPSGTITYVLFAGAPNGTSSLTAIANAVVEAEIDALETYNRTTNTAATITGPTSGSNALTITTDAAYLPIKSIT
jgi:hypothetical protein